MFPVNANSQYRKIIALALALASLSASADDSLTAGESIYRHGLRSDGTPVTALVQGDVELPAGSAACASCHRRSGIGIAEGGTARSLNLTAPALMSARSAPPVRPPYERNTLIRAITAGIAADGRKLDALMPRFRLTEADTNALVSYLETLGAEPSPGVTAVDIEIATIVSEDTPPEIRAAIEGVLQRFVAIKNAGTRQEAGRAAAAERHFFGRNPQRAYRKWNLSIWELTGEAETWPAQLDAYYKARPVFAVVSGATGHDWRLVHAFCERQAVPCLLPITATPPIDDTAFFPVYFSTGATLQAEVTAVGIRDATIGDHPQRVLLVHRDDEAGNTAANALIENLPEETALVTAQSVAAGTRITARSWQQLLAGARYDVLIAWLSDRDLAGLWGLADSRWLPASIYTAQAFSDAPAATAMPDLLTRSQHVYPYSLQTGRRSQFPREETWLHTQGLDALDKVAAAQVLFAVHVLGEALADIKTNFSREFLLESLEHGLDETQMTSLLPKTIIGPNQRFISRGAFIVAPSALYKPSDTPDARWIEP